MQIFTSNNRGLTITEGVVSMVVASSVIIGLMGSMEFGLFAFEKSRAKIQLQQNGSYVMEEFSKLLQGARNYSGSGTSHSFLLPAGNFNGDTLVTLNLQNGKLFRGSRQIVPLQDFSEDISIVDLQVAPSPRLRGHHVYLLLQWLSPRTGRSERMAFETEVYLRNVPAA